MAVDPILVASILATITLIYLWTKLRPSSSHSGKLLPPGPAGVPILGALPQLGTHPHAALANLAKQYGPLIYLKMGTMRVVVAQSPETAKTFLKVIDLQYSNRPSIATIKEITYNNENFTFADYGPRWRLLRKLTSVHMLGGKALADSAPVRRNEISHMLSSLYEASVARQPVKVMEIMVASNANIIGQVMLSRRVFASHGTESSEFKEAVSELLTGEGQFSIGEFLPWLAWFDHNGLQKKLRATIKKLDGLIAELVAEHEMKKAERAGKPDVLDLIMANRVDADGQELSDMHIRALIYDMFSAGTDTSALITEWTLAEMLKNPTLFRRAQAELDEVIGHDRRLDESDFPKLPYLRALCKEALRLHPSTPLSLPHYSREPCEVDGYHIPANTRLLVNIWAIGRDPNVWANPLVFDPDRFLSGKAAKIEPFGNDWELLPFGAGRRICVGMQMGMTMLQTFVGTLVHSFDWRLAEGEELNMEEKFGIVLPKLVPLKVVLTPRLSPAAYAAPGATP